METKNANQKKRLEGQDAEMEMTPMIDVTFLLLIFFMCTLQFKTLEGKLAAYLPKDVGLRSEVVEPLDKVEIKLEVLQEGTRLAPAGGLPWSGESGDRYVYGPDRVLRYSVGPFQTRDLALLQNRLSELFESAPRKADGSPPAATLDPRGAVYEDVVLVLDAALEARFTEITFVGSFER